MHKLFFLLSMYFLTTSSIIAQYAIDDIPEFITEEAKIVIRDSETVLKITSKESATLYQREVVSLMNSDASGYAYIHLPYDSFRKISDIKIKLYDENGNAVKVKAKNLQDVSMASGFQIDDARAKVLDLSGIPFPFSYEIEYETKMKGILTFPNWRPQWTNNMSLEKASIEIHAKDNTQFKYKEHKLDAHKKTEKGDYNIFSWSLADLPAIKREAHQEQLHNKVPYLKLAPNEFVYDDYKGSTKTWNDFGLWYNEIIKDTKAFPIAMQEEIKEMVKNETSDIDKIKMIYKYLQDNTRYVSIQLGIGGLKPFNPDFVHEKKYGDCKALTFYTQAMLKSVGIPSNLVLVKSGRGALDVDADFPSYQFNHLFLCVPQEKDTVWLECTSQTTPFGYLGHHTSDRNVLLIKENGGELVRTPKYAKDENTIIANVKLDIHIDGSAIGSIDQQFNGLEFDRTHFSSMLNLSEKDKEDWIKSYYDISDFSLSEYKFISGHSSDYLGELKSSIFVKKLASTVGKRIFFKPIVVNKFGPKKIKNPEERENGFDIKNTYHHKGTFEYKTPSGFKIEKNVKEIEVSNKFGSYSLKIIATEEGKIVIERVLEINDGEFPANEYVDFVAFLNQIKKFDNQKIALVMTKEP